MQNPVWTYKSHFHNPSGKLRWIVYRTDLEFDTAVECQMVVPDEATAVRFVRINETARRKQITKDRLARKPI